MSSDFFPCPICSRLADPSGDHALACGGNGDRSVRHNALRDVIFSVAQSAALSPRREVPSLLPLAAQPMCISLFGPMAVLLQLMSR